MPINFTLFLEGEEHKHKCAVFSEDMAATIDAISNELRELETRRNKESEQDVKLTLKNIESLVRSDKSRQWAKL